MADKEKGKKDKDQDKKKDKDKGKGEEDLTTRTGVKEESAMADALSPTIRRDKDCIHHQQKLVYFCESCEEPICEQCTILGPHNNQLHRINALGDAFKSRVVAMHQVIAGSLVSKRDQLLAQVYRIDHRLEEVKHVKTIIERDIRAEFEGMQERLRAAEGVKLAVLQHEIANLQRDVDKINDIVNVVNELTGEKGEPIDFLLRFRHLTDMIEFTVAKPFKTNIEVVPYDLPRELATQREKIERMRVVQEVLEMKDHVIFELINKFAAEEEKLTATLNKAAQDEINEWSKLTDRFAAELRKYHIICYYCGCVMDEKNVNMSCDTNNRTQIPVGFGFTVDAPDKGWNGTRRHFFSKPKPELVKEGKISSVGIPDMEYVKRNERDQLLYKTQYHMFLEVLLAKVRKYCQEKKIEVDKLFTEHDKNKTGVINHIAFTFLLHEFCAVDMLEIDKLKTILDPQNKNQIHYMELVKMINDPRYLALFHK